MTSKSVQKRLEAQGATFTMEDRLTSWLNAYFLLNLPFNELCAGVSRVFSNASSMDHMAELASILVKRLCNEDVHVWVEGEDLCINCNGEHTRKAEE